MQTKFTFKHLQPLESIENYAMTRIGKVDKLALHQEPKVHFIFSVQREDQVAEVIVNAGHIHLTAKAKDPTLYAAIDKAVDKMERQLHKHKEKVQNHHKFELSNEGYLRRELVLQAKNARDKKSAS
jgi:putative sigma-54 modulation protein